MRKILFLVSFMVVSCTTMTKETNSEEDISKGKELTTAFYSNIKKKNYDDIITILDPQIPAETFNKLIYIRDSVLGSFKDYKIGEIQTERNEINGISKVVFHIQAEGFYDKSKAQEKITFTKDTLDNYYLSGYTYKYTTKL